MRTAIQDNRISLNIGWCRECREDVKIGAVFNKDKQHNCLSCGYMNRYNNETITLNKNGVVIDNTIGNH